MRKKVFGRKLSREKASREALFVALTESLVLNKKIETTKAKAKAVVGMIDHLVTLAKKDSLTAKRKVLKELRGNKKVATILWTDVAKTFMSRAGGFTRITPLVSRKGDLAQMVKLEWVENIIEAKKEEKDKEAKKGKKTKASKKDVKNISAKTK